VPLSELFLFLADRAHHVATVIEPSLRDGVTVLCDRFFYSTIAFQGYGRGLDCQRLLELNRLATNDLRPDLVILLDLPVEDALRRAQHRNSVDGAERDSFEAEELAFHERVRGGFLALAEELPEPFLVLDAREEAETLFKQATQAISALLRCD
jgi:dTMP kinase